jgi:hypothetical protein
MAVVGDRVQVPSKRVGQLPREGVVIGVTGGMLRVKWSGGEESSMTPSMGSLIVVGKVKVGVEKGVPAAKAPSKKTAKTSAKKAAKTSAKKLAKTSGKAGSAKSPSKRSGAHKRGR